MISRTARRYAKQVLRHMKKIAKASHGRLGVYTLSELMNEGKAKTAFARAVIERAMISGITPAQAAKELLEQRGDARMMASQRGRRLTNTSLTEEEKDAIRAYLESLPNNADTSGWVYFSNKENGYIYKLKTSLKHYSYNVATGGDGFEVWDKYDTSELSEEQKNKYEEYVRNGRNLDTVLSGTRFTDEERDGDDSAVASENRKAEGENGLLDSQKPQNKSNRRGSDRSSGTDKRENEGLDLSGVQLMEGSDGTVYGWCEIERDADGNVVARHIYLNDEVLNANTMVHELG